MRTDGVADVLVRIVEQRRRWAAEAGWGEAGGPETGPGAGDPPLLEAASHPFLAALSGAGPAVIAEVKMGSPRLGSLSGRIDPERQARAYAEAGAAALSVVVEPDFFFGSYELLARCRQASGLPAIAKDFVVHPRQLELAREAGASAVLLIAALYDADELAAYARRARRLGLVPLIETHGEEDLERLAGEAWELVGVNNRDLRSFEVDLEHSLALLPRLPPASVKVAESGIASAADVARLHRAGFDALLIGESLLLADDPAAKLRELRGAGRHSSPLVKVCGVTRPEDADAAVELGADLLGLNFYPPSPRCLSIATARAVADAVAGRVPLVGVFVDRPRAEMEEIAGRVGLDLLQLHGDEPAEEVAALGGRAIQVFRVEPEAGERLSPEILEPYGAAWGFLFDVRDERYGGTGHRWRYEALAGLAGSAAAGSRPVLVAGGVRPGSAGRALAASGATGVDVCSGVEAAPGVKDRLLLQQLMAEVGAPPDRGATASDGDLR